MMVRGFVSLMALAMGAPLLAGPADAAIYDCAKASHADEIAICGHAGLSALDSEMGGLWFAYDALPLLMGASGVRQDEAQQFLKDRAACGDDVACLDKAYRTRISTLKSQLKTSIAELGAESSAPALPSAVSALIDDYGEQCSQLGGKLVASRDQPWIVTGDFDQDSVADYLLDTQNMQCSTAATAFCGNGGCRIDIAVSSEQFKPITTMGGQPTVVLADDIDVAIWVSDEQCDGLKPDEACWQVYQWQDGKRLAHVEARPRSD